MIWGSGSASCSIGQATVNDHLRRAEAAGLRWPLTEEWDGAPLSEPERRDFWEICGDSYQVRSLILTSQLLVNRWHEQIGDPTVADDILDRMVHNAHRIDLRGDSMRKSRGEKPEKASH